jgi:hypothetical protein
MISINLVPTIKDILGGGDSDSDSGDICYLEKFREYYVGNTAIMYYKPGISKCGYNKQTYLKDRMITSKKFMSISDDSAIGHSSDHSSGLSTGHSSYHSVSVPVNQLDHLISSTKPLGHSVHSVHSDSDQSVVHSSSGLPVEQLELVHSISSLNPSAISSSQTGISSKPSDSVHSTSGFPVEQLIHDSYTTPSVHSSVDLLDKHNPSVHSSVDLLDKYVPSVHSSVDSNPSVHSSVHSNPFARRSSDLYVDHRAASGYIDLPLDSSVDSSLDDSPLDDSPSNANLKSRGILNVGNTCFANALFQMLSYIPEWYTLLNTSEVYYMKLLKKLFKVIKDKQNKDPVKFNMIFS